MKKMRKGIIASVGILAFIASLLMLQLTTPMMVGPLGVLAFFILVYIACGSVVYLLMVVIIGFLRKTMPQGKKRLMLETVSEVKIYYFSSVIALAPVILLGMRSVGSVGAVDVVLLVIFEVLGCFYISRRF